MRTRTTATTFVLVLGLTTATSAATVFYDDFEDGIATDGSPVTWEVVSPWLKSAFSVTEGNLRVTATQSGNNAVIGVPAVMLGDTSIRAQVRLEGASDEVVAVFVRGTASVNKSYAIEIAADGGLWFNSGGQYERISTDLRPTEEDVILQIDAMGDTISYWAWRATEAMPELPLRSRTDDRLPGGVPGVYYGISDPPQVNPGIAVYRYVHVATTPIPEPSTITLLALGFVGIGLCCGGRRIQQQ